MVRDAQYIGSAGSVSFSNVLRGFCVSVGRWPGAGQALYNRSTPDQKLIELPEVNALFGRALAHLEFGVGELGVLTEKGFKETQDEA